MIANTIIVAYRERPKQLQLFLESMTLPQGWQLFIVDLGSRDNSADIIASHKERLNISHFRIPYYGTFWKTKALNYGLKRVTTEWVTVVDVDCIFSRDFWQGVGDYLTKKQKIKKLGYRIYRFPFVAVRQYVFQHYENWYADFHRHVIDRPSHYPNNCYEQYEGHKTGNSHLTMRLADLMGLGGYDERFIGYGHEDHDLNMRAWQKFGDTEMYEYPIFQVTHNYETTWQTEELMMQNHGQFMVNEIDGFPELKHQKGFGEFEEGIEQRISKDKCVTGATPNTSSVASAYQERKEKNHV